MDRLVSPLFFCDNVLNKFELKFEFQGLILNTQKNRWIYWIFPDFSDFFPDFFPDFLKNFLVYEDFINKKKL